MFFRFICRPWYALGLFLFVAASGCGSSSTETARALYEDGRDAYEAGLYVDAILLLKSAIQDQPDLGPARELLAATYLTVGRAEDALKEAEAAIASGHSGVSIQQILVRALTENRLLARAEESMSVLPQGDPDTDLAVGRLRLVQKRNDEALDAFSSVLDRLPNAIEAEIGIAQIELSGGELDKAHERLSRVIEENDKSPSAHYFLGIAELSAGDVQQARTSLERASKLNPYDLRTEYALLRAYWESNDFEAAEKRLAKLKQSYANLPAIDYYRGVHRVLRGELERAVEDFRTVLAVAPTHAMSQYYLGLLMFRTGQYEQAEAFLEKSVKQNPDSEIALKLLAAVQLRLNQPDAALESLNHVAALREGRGDFDLLSLRATANLRLGNVDASIGDLEHALDMRPDNERLRTKLVLQKIEHGRDLEVVEFLREGGGFRDEVFAQAILTAYAHIRREAWGKVIEVADSYIAEVKPSPYLLNAKGIAHARQSEVEPARASFRKALEQYPEFVDGLRNLALLELDASELDSARAVIGRLLEVAPDDGRSLTLKGKLEMLSGNTEAGIKAYFAATADPTRALEAAVKGGNILMVLDEPARALELISPVRPWFQFEESLISIAINASLRLGDLDAAEKEVVAASTLVPESALLSYLAGTVRMNQQRYQLAESNLQRAVVLDPEAKNPVATLAALYIRTDRLDAASRQIEKLADLAGTDSIQYLMISGDFEGGNGDWEAAADRYAAAREIAPSSDLVRREHAARAKAGQLEAAIAVSREWLNDHPEDNVVRLSLADTLSGLGRYEQASQQLEQALKIEPDSAITLNNLALAYEGMDDGRALEIAERAYNLAPDSIPIADTYGWLMVKAGRVETGLNILRSALAALPDHGEIRYHAAVGMARSGNRSEAIKALEMALASNSLDSREAAEELLAALSRSTSR